MNQVEEKDTHGPYFGSELTRSECDVLAIANIGVKLRDREQALMKDKWFDYRPMHPTQATYLFAHHFNRAYGNFMNVGYGKGGGFMASFKGKDFIQVREKTSFWSLRQKVDELGVRYDFFCRKAMDWHLERGWRRPPRPCHVVNNNDMIVYVMNAWAEECASKIQFAKSSRFTAAQHVGGEDQLAYEDFIVEQIKRKQHPKFALYSALYVHDAIRIETAMLHFSEEVICEAREYNNSLSQER